MKYENVVDIKVGDLWQLGGSDIYIIDQVNSDTVDLTAVDEPLNFYRGYPIERMLSHSFSWDLISRAK